MALLGTTRMSRHQKGGFTGVRDSEWQWHQLHTLLIGTGLIGHTAWFFCSRCQPNSIYLLCYATLAQYMPTSCVLCGCSIPAAEWLNLSAVGITQLAHTAGKSIFCREGWRNASQMSLGRTWYYYEQCCLHYLRVLVITVAETMYEPDSDARS